MAPSKMKAAVTTGPDGKVEVREIDVPEVGPTDVLVKVVAAASNPTDCTYLPFPLSCRQSSISRKLI